jgi:hypothetical protein
MELLLELRLRLAHLQRPNICKEAQEEAVAITSQVPQVELAVLVDGQAVAEAEVVLPTTGSPLVQAEQEPTALQLSLLTSKLYAFHRP